MGKPESSEHSIDRIDNEKGYSPENCRWTTKSRQSRNTRMSRMLTVDGIKKSIHDWADETGLSFFTIRKRLNIGWTDEEAVRTPIRKRNANLVTC